MTRRGVGATNPAELPAHGGVPAAEGDACASGAGSSVGEKDRAVWFNGRVVVKTDREVNALVRLLSSDLQPPVQYRLGVGRGGGGEA